MHCLCSYNTQEGWARWSLGEKHLLAIDRSKFIVLIGHTTHFDSTKKCFSYGNKGNFDGVNNGNFDGVNNIPMAQYVNKKSSSKVQINATVIKEMSSTDIEVSINDLS